MSLQSIIIGLGISKMVSKLLGCTDSKPLPRVSRFEYELYKNRIYTFKEEEINLRYVNAMGNDNRLLLFKENYYPLGKFHELAGLLLKTQGLKLEDLLVKPMPELTVAAYMGEFYRLYYENTTEGLTECGFTPKGFKLLEDDETGILVVDFVIPLYE